MRKNRGKYKFVVIIDPEDNRKIFKQYVKTKREFNLELKKHQLKGNEVVNQRWSEFYSEFLIEYKKPIKSISSYKKYKDSETLRKTIRDHYSDR